MRKPPKHIIHHQQGYTNTLVHLITRVYLPSCNEIQHPRVWHKKRLKPCNKWSKRTCHLEWHELHRRTRGNQLSRWVLLTVLLHLVDVLLHLVVDVGITEVSACCKKLLDIIFFHTQRITSRRHCNAVQNATVNGLRSQVKKGHPLMVEESVVIAQRCWKQKPTILAQKL